LGQTYSYSNFFIVKTGTHKANFLMQNSLQHVNLLKVNVCVNQISVMVGSKSNFD